MSMAQNVIKAVKEAKEVEVKGIADDGQAKAKVKELGIKYSEIEKIPGGLIWVKDGKDVAMWEKDGKVLIYWK